MKVDIYKNFEMNFPLIAKDIVEYRSVSKTELIIKSIDGDIFLYDDVYRSIRKLPKNSNDMSEKECKNEFGIRLFKIMSRQGITQAELSHMTGIQQPILSGYITGKNSPSFYKVDKIAKALGCSTDDLRYFD